MFKLIATIHIGTHQTAEQKLSLSLKHLSKFVGKFFYKSSEVVVGVSHGVSKDAASFYHLNQKIKTIYNGVPNLKPLNTELPSVRGKVTKIITVCRLSEQKDPLTLLLAFAQITKQYPACQLTIIGDGKMKEELIQASINLGIKNNTNFLGWKKDPITYLSRSDVFVLSSKREGFPYAILEAMSLGIPVVATDAPFGPNEILGDGRYGILIPVGDVNAMRVALEELITSKTQRNYYSGQSLKRATYFSEEKMLTSYSNLIQELVENDHLDKSRI